MERINVLLLLTPKTELACLSEDMTARQAIEKIKAHGYMAVPVISKGGEYLGTITEGDLLWKLVSKNGDIEALNKVNIKELIRSGYTQTVKVDADTKFLASMITNQNFVPVVDDRNILMGIVTRKKVIKALLENED